MGRNNVSFEILSRIIVPVNKKNKVSYFLGNFILNQTMCLTVKIIVQ